MATLSVSEEGVRLIQRWHHATKHLERLKSELNSAECELANAQNDLGRWMIPSEGSLTGSLIGEKFSICIEGGFLNVTQTGPTDYTVCWRKKPSGKNSILAYP